MRKLVNFAFLFITIFVYSQKPILDPGIYRSNVKGQKIMLKVFEDNNYEMSFLYGKYTVKNDTITFANTTSGDSSFKIKINETPFSSTFKVKIQTEFITYFARNIYIGTQKDDNAIVEFKPLDEYLSKKSNNFESRQKQVSFDIEKTKYLYFVENTYQNKGATISKFQIDSNANELEVTYEPSLNVLELKGFFDSETKKLTISEGLGRSPLFSFEKDGTAEVKKVDEIKPLQVVVEKDWLKKSGFEVEEDTTAFFGEREASIYTFKHTPFKSYQEAIKSIEKTPTKFLVLVVDDSKSGKKSYDEFIKQNERQMSRFMRNGYNASRDHFNFYFATDREKALLESLKIKDKTAFVFLNSNGEMVYHTKAILDENSDLFDLYYSIYDEILIANSKLKLDKIAANKKATLPDFKKALFDIVQTKKSDNDYDIGAAVDTATVEVVEDYGTMAVDSTAAVAMDDDYYEGNYLHAQDPENLYKFKTSKQVIMDKWKLLTDFYLKNNTYDEDFIEICKRELNDKGFTFKLFDEKKQLSDLDFKILDYLFKNFELIQKNNEVPAEIVDEYGETLYEPADNKINLSSSLRSFFQKKLNNSSDLSQDVKSKLIDYYKSFLKLSGYDLIDFESYLSNIDQGDATDKTFYFSEFDNFFQTISSKNSSIIETLNEMFTERKNNFVNWNEFKNTFTQMTNNAAWKVVETKVSDSNTIQKAIKWSEASLKVDKKSSYYLDTLAQLYYKNNEKDKAIATEQKAIDAITDKSGTQLDDYKEVLEKMKNGTY